MQDRRYMLPESLRAVANMLEEIQRVQKLTESRLSYHGADLENLKAELQRQVYVQERQSKEIYRLKQELDSLKSARTAQEARNPKESPAVLSNHDAAKTSSEEAPLAQRDVIPPAPFAAGNFYKTAPAQKTADKYITASVPLGSEPQAQPTGSSAAGQTAAAAAAVLPTARSVSQDQKKQSNAQVENSQPILPGSGFSHITIDFLRKLSEKKS